MVPSPVDLSVLQIRNDPKKGFFVENLTQNAVADYDSISKVRPPRDTHACPIISGMMPL